jgi:hypothetical protein
MTALTTLAAIIIADLALAIIVGRLLSAGDVD